MSEMITKNHALVARFGDTLDQVLLDGIENFVANSRPTLGGERFLTDREVSARLKVSRRTLQDYRNTGIIAYYQLGGKILYKERTSNECLPTITGRRSDSIHSCAQKEYDQRVSGRIPYCVWFRISFISTAMTVPGVCRWRKEQT